MKRLFDFLIASLGLIGFAPAGFLFALLLKLEDGGPIFYFQERWGRGGQRFKIYKFRTMFKHADKIHGFKPKEHNDSRVTKIGKFLRATAMDELPQLINIWKGDMSFVGPRPLAIQEINPETPLFKERHQVRPGLTGPAQLYTSRNSPLEEKFKYDLDYVHHRTLGKDLKYMFTSVAVTLRGEWEILHRKGR